MNEITQSDLDAVKSAKAFCDDMDEVEMLQLIADHRITARSEALEEAAKLVDQCNREGPYNAIGAAKQIRALKGQG